MKTVTLSALLICFWCNTTNATEFVTTKGSIDCGRWVSARTANNAGVFEGFAQGLINGMVIGSRMDIWQGNGVDSSPSQLFLFIDKHCRDNPLSDVIQGAMEFATKKTNGAINKKK